MHLALMDSTGWGLLNSKAASAGAVIADECAYVVSPGSSLHGAGQHPYLQVPLVQAVAQEEVGVWAPFFAATSPIRVIAIKTKDSTAIDLQNSNKRFENMIRYREDMGVVEYSRTIMSFKDEFPNLYHVSDLAHVFS